MEEINHGDLAKDPMSMTTLKVKVKWGKETYDVELDLKEDPEVFKAQLFALTGVTPDRQKVMCKGAILKDSWESVKVKEGSTILMMGSKGELPQAPVEKTVFVEDMDSSQLATALNLPCGLYNLGNTCYLNAVVQCLRSVPELAKYLATYNVMSNDPFNSPADQIACSLRDLFWNMEQRSVIRPLFLVDFWRRMFPRFAEKDENGTAMQQDANESWTELVRVLDSALWRKAPAVGVDAAASSPPECKQIMRMLFRGELQVTMKCTESEVECETRSTEDFFQLSCFISSEVKYLIAGLKLRMQENITKMSSTLGRDAVYQKNSKISRLPGYLTVSIVRFFYKEKEAVNAKILKDVKFPMMLDVFELCSSDLQKTLIPQRDKFKAWEDEAVAKKAEPNRDREGDKPTEETAEDQDSIPFSFPDDPGSNNSGFYQLQAVLTHKGRSSSSGHYVAWVRRGKEWFKCDDETVTPVLEEDILKLSGGGDWHVAYVLLYGPRLLGKS